MTLKVALAKAGVRQIKMASDLCIHASTMSKIANGWITPDPELAATICSYLGLKRSQIRFGRHGAEAG
jgi:DNA-binding XRE family transcriptional regulator